jgi:hypothetical protein
MFGRWKIGKGRKISTKGIFSCKDTEAKIRG